MTTRSAGAPAVSKGACKEQGVLGFFLFNHLQYLCTHIVCYVRIRKHSTSIERRGTQVLFSFKLNIQWKNRNCDH